MSDLDELLVLITKAPEDDIAKEQTEKVGKLVGLEHSEIRKGLEEILSDCCEYSLASDFAMVTMQIAYELSKD